MADDPEALAQIARLLGQDRLRVASREEVRLAIDASFQHLVDGLIAETSASDDVIDRESALVFVHDRLRFLQPLLRDDQRDRLAQSLSERFATW